jgi:hypothetical protein
MIQQNAFCIHNRTIHSFVGFIYRNGGDFADGMSSISETALVCFVWREPEHDNLFKITMRSWKAVTVTIANGIMSVPNERQVYSVDGIPDSDKFTVNPLEEETQT